LNGVSQITWRETFIIFNKERSRFRLENLRSARCSLSVFFKVLTARARKKKKQKNKKRTKKNALLARWQRPFDTPGIGYL